MGRCSPLLVDGSPPKPAIFCARRTGLLRMRAARVNGSSAMSESAFPTLAPFVAAAVMGGVQKRYPSVALEVITGTAEDLNRRVGTGDLDLTFTGVRLPPSFEVVELFAFELSVILPADHRLARRRVVDLRDLAQEPLILLDTSPSREHVLGVLRSEGISPLIGFRTSNFELVRSMVGHALGWSLARIRPWGDHSYDGKPLAPRPLARPEPYLPTVLVRRRDVRPSAAVRAVIDVVTSHKWLR